MINNAIGDCPKQCDVWPLDFIEDYRKDLLTNLKDGEKSSEVYERQDSI